MDFIPLCGKAFDVNNRIVYTMRTLGHGYAGIQKFTNLNMPKPMTEKNYNRTAKKEKEGDVVQEVANGQMKDATKQLHEKAKSDGKEVIDVEVSCDGMWQKKRLFLVEWCFPGQWKNC